jgi:serine/threonine protein kinase
MGATQSHLGYHRRREVLRRPPPMTSKPNAGNLDPLLTRVIAGNFRVEKLLGSGAMGNVYKAEQLSLSKAVAVKVLHPHLMSDDKLVLRFKREAKSASLLNHPNSIQIIDSGQDKDGTLYIAMELLTGRDLAQVIRDDFPIPVPRIVRIMSQVLSALDEAHIQGVIHRDLKPSNIMLIERRGEADFVKVCDFGIAKAAQDAKEDRESMLTIQGLVCGTPEYMAPEQARGEVLDGRADLYAAAVILFQMVTGDIPFKGDTPMAIVSRHLVEAPAIPSRRRTDVPIPPALDALILKGMEKSRELRFPNATAFREALEAIGAAGDVHPPSTPDLRAQMATTQVSSSGAGLTAVVASSDPAAHFGATSQLRRRSRRLPMFVVVAGVAAAAGVLFLRMPKVDPGLPGIAATATTQMGQMTGPGTEPALPLRLRRPRPRRPTRSLWLRRPR